MIGNPRQSAQTPFFGWRMVLLACVCVNVGVGFTFGAYGTFMPSMVAEFSASRALASAGLSLMVACMGFLAPVTGYAVRRWSIRGTLGTGFLLMSAGWALMGVAGNAWQFILAFGLLCGPAVACLVIVPPLTLINNWFIARRGQAAGILMAGVLLMVVPPLAAAGITAHGWRPTSLAISLIALLMSPVTLLIVDRPESLGQKPLGSSTQPEPKSDARVSPTKRKPPTRDAVFWVLILSAGLYGGIGVAFSGHFVPFALEHGLNLGGAAFLLSIFGAAGLGGGFLGGTLADRIGGAATFALFSLCQALAWACLVLAHDYGLLALAVVIIGICGNATLPVTAALLANVFGRERFAQIMGIYSVVSTPFSLAMPLLAGALYDLAGSYRPVFLGAASLFTVAGAIYAFAHRIEVGRRAASGAASVLAVDRL